MTRTARHYLPGPTGLFSGTHRKCAITRNGRGTPAGPHQVDKAARRPAHLIIRGGQHHSRHTAVSSPGAGIRDCRDQASGGPWPSRPLTGDTQFEQTMPEPGRPHRHTVRPQIPGLSPGGLGPHLASSGSRPGFLPVSRLPARARPLRPPSSVSLVRRSLVRPLRPPLSGPVPRRFPSRFPFLEQPSH